MPRCYRVSHVWSWANLPVISCSVAEDCCVRVSVGRNPRSLCKGETMSWGKWPLLLKVACWGLVFVGTGVRRVLLLCICANTLNSNCGVFRVRLNMALPGASLLCCWDVVILISTAYKVTLVRCLTNTCLSAALSKQ